VPAPRGPLQRLAGRLPRREGGAWVVVALAVPRLVGAAFTILLQRYLGPGPIGTFALAEVPYRLLDGFRNFGTGPALVYEPTVDRALANTAWTLNMVFAVAATVAAQLLAHPLAVYYGHSDIEGILRVLSIGYLFASVASPHSFLLMRDLNFQARSIAPFGQVVVASCVALIFVVWDFGVAALVAREVVSVVVGMVILWAVYPFRPRLQLVPDLAGRLLRYGVWIGLGLTVLYLSQNVDVFIGGHFIKKEDMGFYSTAWGLAFIAAGSAMLVATSLIFPTLSRLQHDPTALQETLLRALRQLAVLVFPASGALAVLAPVLILPLLGGKWLPYRDSFVVLSLLAVYAGNRTLLYAFFEGYKAVGKPWIVSAYNGVKLAVMVPSMVLAARHGIIGLAFVYIPLQLVEIPLALWLAARVLRVSPRAVWRAVRVALASAVVMAAAVAIVELLLLSRAHVRDVVALLACLPVAAGVYIGALMLFDRTILAESRRVLAEGL